MNENFGQYSDFILRKIEFKIKFFNLFSLKKISIMYTYLYLPEILTLYLS